MTTDELLDQLAPYIEAITQERSRLGNEWVVSSFDPHNRDIVHARGKTLREALEAFAIAIQ